MATKRICKGACVKFKVKKPSRGGRYETGQARCQTCDVWLDYRGGHLKDGSPAEADSPGWFCNCCNYRVRKNPRNIEFKAKMRAKPTPESDSEDVPENEVDLSYFNKRRAHMLRRLAESIVAQDRHDIDAVVARLSKSNSIADEVEKEFDVSLKDVINAACSKSSNKASLIVEFESVRHRLGTVPTKQDMQDHSVFDTEEYESEFGSWEHFLERLGYDPWYRDVNEPSVPKPDQGMEGKRNNRALDSADASTDLESARTAIRNALKDDSVALNLFSRVDQNITKLDADHIKKILRNVKDD